jgi:hypothetical protein
VLPALQEVAREGAEYAERSTDMFDLHQAKRRTARKLAQLESIVSRLVPDSHELYPRLFSERLICEQYKRAQELQQPVRT